MSENETKNHSPTFAEALRFWLKLGFISFGGPAGQIAIMHRVLVDEKRWIDDEDFLHALNFCMLLPGPEAQQLATYNGWRLHGIKGGIVAGAFFVLPSVFILLTLSYIYARFGSVREVAAILDGLKPIVVAIVVEAVWKIGNKAFKSWFSVFIAALAFIAIFSLHIPFPLIVLGAGFLGFLTSKANNPEAATQHKNNEQSKIKNQKSKIIAVFAGLWLLPFVLSGFVFGFNSLPVQIYLFFTQAAFVTFGGAYAVLAYVNQAVVNSFGWITTQQAIDGFALAETTPGPLIMVLQNIGFLAGWNNAGEFNQTLFAVICALLTTYATFLPSFMFIFLGAPYIERLRGNRTLSAALAGVTAAVVGVILNLALVFGTAVIFHDSQINRFGLIISVLAFIALFRFKVDVLWLVLFGSLAGLAKVVLGNS
jgi:chromate transporter